MRTQLAQRKNQRIRITTEIIKITPIKKAKNTIYKLALRNITSTEFTGKVTISMFPSQQHPFQKKTFLF